MLLLLQQKTLQRLQQSLLPRRNARRRNRSQDQSGGRDVAFFYARNPAHCTDPVYCGSNDLMARHTLILQLTCATVLAVAGPAHGLTVHPVSHTDAWVRVSDRVDVRLNIFLDDVLRYEGLLKGEPGEISRQAVVEAIDAYSLRVVGQLQIYGPDGQPLRAELTSAPTWRQTADRVDLSANDLLKLTWKVRYTASDDSDLSLLTFEHQFSDPSLPTPGELRLHVQHQPTSRRLDAVVPPNRPHVLHLPADRAAVTGRDLNLMQARLMLNAGLLSVELMAPAALMNGAFEHRDPQAAPLTLDERTAFFERWATRNATARMNGRSIVPDQIIVEFPDLSPESRADGALTEAERSAPVNWRTRLVGIRLEYARPRRVETFSLTVDSWPVMFDDVALELITPNSRSSSLIATATDDGPSFFCEWQPDAQAAAWPPDDRAAAPQRLQRREPDRWWRSVAAVLVTGWLLLLLQRWWTGRLPVTRMLVGSALVLTAASFCVTRVSYRAEPKSIHQYVQMALDGVYRTLQWNDDRAVVERLSVFLEPDMTERAFLSAIDSLRGDSQEPVTSIQDLRVIQVNVRPGQTPGRLQCDCQWHVRVLIDHWGHVHQRQLNLSGTLQLVQAEDTWRIRDFRPQAAGFAENSVETRGRSENPSGA